VNLDRRHVIASLVLLAAAVAYNIWAFAGGSSRAPGGAAPPLDPPAIPLDAASGPAPIDPARVAAPTDVAFDRLPTWPRDPFADVRRRPVVVAEETVAPAADPVVEPDPVVASILYSPDRRLAMINGRIVRVGEPVGGSVVVDILPNAVVIEAPGGGRRRLELKTPRTVVTPR
jgi:hypothetical protein